MRVLLAGASGAIGRHLIPELIASGHEVIGITRAAGSLEGTGATELVADVSHRSTFLKAIEGVKAGGVISQLTSLSKPPLSFRHMNPTNRLRSEGTSTLMAAARRIGASRFVTASIIYGYGFGDAGVDELDETAPFAEPDGTKNNAVLRALLTNEQQVLAFGGVALRYGLFYAPGAKEISPVARHWNGLVPVIHLHDAARATVLALERGHRGEAYNIVDDEPVTWRELQEMQARADGFSPPIVLSESLLRAAAPFGSQLMTTLSLRLSNSKAKSQLKWKLEYPSLREGLPALAPTAPLAAADAGASPAPEARSAKARLLEAPAALARAGKAAVQKNSAKPAVKEKPAQAAAQEKPAKPVVQAKPAKAAVPEKPAKPAVQEKSAAVEAPAPMERLRSLGGTVRLKLDERAAEREARKALRDAERAVERAAALERAEQAAIRAELETELARERAAEQAARAAEVAPAEEPPAEEADAEESATDEAETDEADADETVEPESRPDDEGELGDYTHSDSYVDTYFDDPEPEAETADSEDDANKELDKA